MDHIIESRWETEEERFEYTLHTEIHDFRCEAGCGALREPRWQDREEGLMEWGAHEARGWGLDSLPRCRTPAQDAFHAGWHL